MAPITNTGNARGSPAPMFFQQLGARLREIFVSFFSFFAMLIPSWHQAPKPVDNAPRTPSNAAPYSGRDSRHTPEIHADASEDEAETTTEVGRLPLYANKMPSNNTN